MVTQEKITLRQALEYEIHSSRIVPYVSSPILQKILGNYYASKAKRKYSRYLVSLEMKNQHPF